MPITPRLTHGTVCVPHMETALQLYRDLLEQTVISDGQVTPAEALAWDAPSAAFARAVVLQPPSGKPVYLRLIERPTPQTIYKPGTHLGWAALELTVKNADTLHQRLVNANIPIIGPPKALAFTDKLYPMQALGPGGEALYLNEVRGDLPSSDLPLANCWVDELFITIVGASNREKTVDFYNDLLGTKNGGTWEIEYGVINRAFDFPSTTKHALSTCNDGRIVLFEVDHFPEVATPKPCDEGDLCAGVCIVGLVVDSFPATANWLTPPAVRAEAPYFGAMVGVLRGLDGEMVELVLRK